MKSASLLIASALLSGSPVARAQEVHPDSLLSIECSGDAFKLLTTEQSRCGQRIQATFSAATPVLVGSGGCTSHSAPFHPIAEFQYAFQVNKGVILQPSNEFRLATAIAIGDLPQVFSFPLSSVHSVTCEVSRVAEAH